MRYQKLEKDINRIDKDIQGLTLAKKYLSNTDEIETIKTQLNKERQKLVEEIYSEDTASRHLCAEMIEPLLNKELNQQEQVKLLEDIKEIYGRKCPEVSKESHGLNAWLKAVNATYEWKQVEGSEWTTLVISAVVPKIVVKK